MDLGLTRTLLCVKEANEDLLYSTGNSAQYSNGLYGKKDLKKGGYIHV